MLGHHYKLNQEIKNEIAKAKLPPYQGGPGVDYTNSSFAYAVSIALVHLTADQVAPNHATHTLLVQRSSGHGIIGSWSGVSGYIDTICDPNNAQNDVFDPIMHTAKNELHEECGLDHELINNIGFHLGPRFTTEKFGGGILHIIPLLGVYKSQDRPIILPDPQEISGYQWVRVASVQNIENIEQNFHEQTLPSALAAFGSQRLIS